MSFLKSRMQAILEFQIFEMLQMKKIGCRSLHGMDNITAKINVKIDSCQSKKLGFSTITK